MALRMDLAGRRVLVTGASSGIGAATCRAIVACGGTVAMIARRKERLDQLRDELGENALPVPCDVTDLPALERSIADAAAALGGLNGVIAVAGKTMVGTVATGTPEKWRELFDLNLMSPLATVRHALEHFPTEGRRDVVLISSSGALTPMPGVGIYAASKRGLLAAFDSLRLELAVVGINVSCVMPGMFETEALTMEGLVFDGDIPPDDIPWFAPETGPASADDLAESVAFMISRPLGLCISELVVRPTGQLYP